MAHTETVPFIESRAENDAATDCSDPKLAVYGHRKSSVSAGVLNLSTTAVGAGIMGLPATMKILGLPFGLLFLVAVAVFTFFSIEFLLRFSDRAKMQSYSGVMGDAFGPSGRVCLQIFIILKTVGILVIYMIIIADVVSGTSDGVHHRGVLEEWFGVCWWTSRAGALALTTLLVLVPLVSFRDVDSLRYSSAVSVALAVVFLVVTATITLIKLIRGDVHMPRILPDVHDLTSFWKLFQIVPVMVTAYICHYNVHPIQNELANPDQMKQVVKITLSLCTTIYLLTSFFGYLLFGEDTMTDVLANFDRDLGIPYSSLLNDIVRISYAVHLMLVFPVIHFALRLNLDELVFPSAEPLKEDPKRFFIITAGLVSFIFVGAIFIPDLWNAFQVLGSTVAVTIGFIFPGSIVLRDAHHIAKIKDTCLALFMVIVAVVCSAIALSSDVFDAIKKIGI